MDLVSHDASAGSFGVAAAVVVGAVILTIFVVCTSASSAVVVEVVPYVAVDVAVTDSASEIATTTGTKAAE